MFPAAMVMCWIGTQADARFGLPPLPALLVPLGLAMIAAGGVWVWYVYGYLYLAGGGSPGTHVDGGPTTMVDTGPFTMVRHPSVLGKLTGVIGLGLVWGSPSFTFGFTPVLVAYSLVTNRYLQERFCDARFGARYALYRSRVPMLLPRITGVRRWLQDESAVPDDAPAAPAPPPEGVWLELPGYLVGLALLMGLFSLIAWVV